MKKKIEYIIIGIVLIALIGYQNDLFAGFSPQQNTFTQWGTSTSTVGDYSFYMVKSERLMSSIPIYGEPFCKQVPEGMTIISTDSDGCAHWTSLTQTQGCQAFASMTRRCSAFDPFPYTCNLRCRGWCQVSDKYSNLEAKCYGKDLGNCGIISNSVGWVSGSGQSGISSYNCGKLSIEGWGYLDEGGTDYPILKTENGCAFKLTVKYKGSEIFKANYGNWVSRDAWYFKDGNVYNSEIPNYDVIWSLGGYTSDQYGRYCTTADGEIHLGYLTISYSTSEIYELGHDKFIDLIIDQDKADYFGTLTTTFTIQTSLGDVTQEDIQEVNIPIGSNTFKVQLPDSEETIIVHPILKIKAHGSDIGSNLQVYYAFADISSLDIDIGTLDFGEFEAGTVIEEVEAEITETTVIVVEAPSTQFFEPSPTGVITTVTPTEEEPEGLSKNMIALIVAGLGGLYLLTLKKPKTKK